MSIEYDFKREYDEQISIRTHEHQIKDGRAKDILECILRWGMVAGKPDGYDKQGRQKLKLLKPEEVVDRAFHCVNLAYTRLEKERSIVPVATLAELHKILDATEQKED